MITKKTESSEMPEIFNRPVFSSSWWLDATAGVGNWGRAEVAHEGKVIASLPWVMKKHWSGFKILSQPPLTQTLGPWVSQAPTGTKYARKLAREKDLFFELIDQLPQFHSFTQNFSPEITNWLPFYWKGFSQTTRFTYRLKNLLDEEHLWNNFQDKIKTDIRKARKKGVTVEQSEDIEAFLTVNEKTFIRQKIPMPYKKEFIRHIFSCAKKHNAGTIFLARGPDGQVHAGNFIVWNSHCAFYLLGGGDPELRNSGGTSLALWHAIQFSSKVSGIFDFEGSMLEPVERFIRGFGAIQTPYSQITQCKSRLLLSIKNFKAAKNL